MRLSISVSLFLYLCICITERACLYVFLFVSVARRERSAVKTFSVCVSFSSLDIGFIELEGRRMDVCHPN